MVWKSSPFLKGMINSFGTTEAKRNVEMTTELMQKIFKTNPLIPAHTEDNYGNKDHYVGAFEMANHFEE
jgi:hypothetical protein